MTLLASDVPPGSKLVISPMYAALFEPIQL